jgi:hypothetical protein
MPNGTSRNSSSRRPRRASTRARSDTASVVGQISQLVAANEALQRQNRDLIEDNQRLRGELTAIGSALGRLSGPGGGRSRRGRGGAPSDVLAGLTEAKPRRQRKPITDPEALERRRQALAKARAVRAEKLAAARAGASSAG